MSKTKPTIKVSKNKAKAKAKAKKKQSFSWMDLPDELAERGREIWLAGLGALSTVEEGGVKMFKTLVEKGEAWEKTSGKQIGAAKQKFDEARDKMESKVGEVAKKGSKIAEIDDVIIAAAEDAVEKGLHRLGVPTHTELKDLAGKVENLSVKVAALAVAIEKKKNSKAPAKNGEATTATAKTAKKVVYHVVPHGDTGWVVKEEHVDVPLSEHTTKVEAVEAGRAIAKGHQPSRLVTHRKDGKVQESVTYDA